MLRIYHNHEKWEDLEMWYNKPFDLQKAIDFINDIKEFAKAMFRVICEYRNSCQHNLTSNINRVAWLGQAACFYAIGCPESITREAWGHLSKSKKQKANNHAQRNIDLWEWLHHGKGIKPVSGPYIDAYLQKDYDVIPDNLPSELDSICPSFRMICKAILKNDLYLTSLGYSKPKTESYNILKQIELNERAASRQQKAKIYF